MKTAGFRIGLVAACAVSAAAARAPAPKKVEIVSVTGCLKEATPNNWTLVNATDPVPSIANASSPKEIPSVAPSGDNEFKLIGDSEFNLPQHKDRAVIVKGLFIKVAPPAISRVNITSVTDVSASCPARTAK